MGVAHEPVSPTARAYLDDEIASPTRSTRPSDPLPPIPVGDMMGNDAIDEVGWQEPEKIYALVRGEEGGMVLLSGLTVFIGPLR